MMTFTIWCSWFFSALRPLTQREGETDEEFAAWQRMIARSNVMEEEEEGDYDTIDKK
jgi:hypothetical protein